MVAGGGRSHDDPVRRAQRPPAGEMPVVLAAGASGILLHEAIGHGMEADFNRKGTSIYSDDDRQAGRRAVRHRSSTRRRSDDERGALNVDDEGNDAERTVLVENGMLRTLPARSRSARDHYKVDADRLRAAASRTATRRCRACAARTCRTARTRRDEIIASVKTGIICETFTNGQVQIGAGDFTFYVKNGWLIEDGKLTAPIKDVNIIGNGPEALQQHHDGGERHASSTRAAGPAARTARACRSRRACRQCSSRR